MPLATRSTACLYDLRSHLQPTDCELINDATFNGEESFALGDRTLSVQTVAEYIQGKLEAVDGTTYKRRPITEQEKAALERLHELMIKEKITIVDGG